MASSLTDTKTDGSRFRQRTASWKEMGNDHRDLGKTFDILASATSQSSLSFSMLMQVQIAVLPDESRIPRRPALRCPPGRNETA